MALKFYTSMAKELKLKIKKVLKVVSYVCRSYRGKGMKSIHFIHFYYHSSPLDELVSWCAISCHKQGLLHAPTWFSL